MAEKALVVDIPCCQDPAQRCLSPFKWARLGSEKSSQKELLTKTWNFSLPERLVLGY